MHKKRSPVERFWEKVAIDPHGCWLWTASLTSTGYGQLTRGSRGEGNYKAHRFAWEIEYGPIPENTCVLHRCDTPACVRPSHLFLGTLADNSRDMAAKGRWRNTNTKLTPEAVINIRRRHAQGERGKDLAIAFDVTRATICDITKGRSWKDPQSSALGRNTLSKSLL